MKKIILVFLIFILISSCTPLPDKEYHDIKNELRKLKDENELLISVLNNTNSGNDNYYKTIITYNNVYLNEKTNLEELKKNSKIKLEDTDLELKYKNRIYQMKLIKYRWYILKVKKENK